MLDLGGMHNLAIVDLKEQLCSVSIFSERWSNNNHIKTVTVTGSFLQPETAQRVRQEIENVSGGETSVVILLPRIVAQITSLEIPATNTETLKKMMEFEVMRIFPIPAEKLCYDYCVTDSDEANYRLNIAGLRAEDFDKYYESAINAGLSPEIISISSAASLFPTAGCAAKRTFIEITPDGFEMSIVDGTCLLYSRFKRFTIPIAEEVFSGPHHMAESSANIITEQLLSEIGQIRLVAGINSLSDFLKAVYIAGGGLLASRTAKQLSASSIFESSNIEKLPKSQTDNSFSFVSKLTGIESYSGKRTGFNFIPRHLRSSSVSGVKRNVALATAVFILLLAIWAGTVVGVKQNMLNRLGDELAALKSEASETEKVLIKVEELQRYSSSFSGFFESSALNLSLLSTLTSALPRNTHLVEIDIRGKEIALSGISSKATSLLNTLESTAMFKDVKMIGPVKAAGSKEKFKIGMFRE